ncbi:Gfo/Idh/MocA family oxidoreductase [Micromonospora sp. DR5-3]|uniref:Gfo/Idh/MocA family protein n=1 Tax=unclassified Micromonospora TaxID=2617518 RepID=UPI0011D53A7B|nr:MULTISPECIES: Gfo/Idh/MocA family oxidoreductase [unclassified Micromonospora]MCW3819227.1 Gfo/Idh/MocA family oxidoreductase [Micromonospora sp. DR5-3]TYC20989.1 Gfo/Idh/MocA family oxidoreductase [Micromonospora sp. MP36]
MTVSLAIVGAGNRGGTYAGYAERFPERARVVAVAEPRAGHRDALADRHQVPAARRFPSWQALADQPRLADAVVVATPDREHLAPVARLAALGYDILLEKPMAPTEQECDAVVDVARRTGVLLTVCHVLRYTPYTAMVKRLLDAGAVGRIVGVDHLEPVGWWHFAHSYVRGNWRRADESSSSLLAKCCHDLDWLRYVVDDVPVRVSSVGALYHFHPGNRPAGAADRCLDCPLRGTCPYAADRFYAECLADPDRHVWPLSVVTRDLSPDGVRTALREGPYGRCVYTGGNDVVDHQTVTVSFAGGATATLTMSAFTPGGHRRTRIMGTRGYLEGDGERVTLTDFVTGETSTLDTAAGGADAGSGHGGGDHGLMAAFVEAVGTGDRSLVHSGPRESLDSHRMAFAAERSRLAGGLPMDV